MIYNAISSRSMGSFKIVENRPRLPEDIERNLVDFAKENEGVFILDLPPYQSGKCTSLFIYAVFDKSKCESAREYVQSIIKKYKDIVLFCRFGYECKDEMLTAMGHRGTVYNERRKYMRYRVC